MGNPLSGLKHRALLRCGLSGKLGFALQPAVGQRGDCAAVGPHPDEKVLIRSQGSTCLFFFWVMENVGFFDQMLFRGLCQEFQLTIRTITSTEINK